MASVRSEGLRGALDRRLVSRLVRGALVVAAMLLGATNASGGMSGPCRVPEVYLTFDSDLKRTERLIDRSAPVRILVLGPQIEGKTLPPPKRSKLEVELRRRLPDVAFKIIDEETVPGLAREDFEQIRSGIERKKPDLVSWQVGTRDALAATDPQEFSRSLDQAADWLKGRDIDLILVDPPFVPNVPHEARYGRIVNQIDTVSDRERLNVVQQYGATSYLFSSPESGSRGGAGQLCLPELIAEAIVRAATR